MKCRYEFSREEVAEILRGQAEASVPYVFTTTEDGESFIIEEVDSTGERLPFPE